MIGTTRAVRVFARAQPTDLRKGFNGLYGLVRNELGQDPLNGDLFLFTNRRRTSSKVLFCDGSGLIVYAKRLFKGQFACLWRNGPQQTVSLTHAELALFLEGAAIEAILPLSPPKFSL